MYIPCENCMLRFSVLILCGVCWESKDMLFCENRMLRFSFLWREMCEVLMPHRELTFFDFHYSRYFVPVQSLSIIFIHFSFIYLVIIRYNHFFILYSMNLYIEFQVTFNDFLV